MREGASSENDTLNGSRFPDLTLITSEDEILEMETFLVLYLAKLLQ